MRNFFRSLSILLLLALAILLPFVFTGYSELRKTSSATSYLTAAGHYQTAARLLPWRADLYELAGTAYYHAREYSQADAAYQIAFQRRALSPEGWVAWGDVNYLDQDPARARDIWNQALDQPHPSEKLYSRLAQMHQDQKEYAKAVEYLQLYVAQHLDDASARYRLGLLLTLSDPNTAISELIAASQLDPEFDPAVQTLRSALNLASLNDNSSERDVIIGRGLGLVNEWELARVVFDSAAQADQANAEAWAWLGEATQHTAEKDRALESQSAAKDYLDRALSLNPNSAVVHTLRGLYFQRAGNPREALAEFQFAALIQPDDPALYVSIGESFSKTGDLIRALDAYQYATTLDSDNALYWRLLALFCAQNDIHINDVGIPAAQRALGLQKNDSAAEDLLGWLWFLNADYSDAERHLMRALELDPQNAAAHYHMGMLYLATDRRVLAREHLIHARDFGNADAQIILNQYFP